MSNVDDLIDELFPEESPKSRQKNNNDKEKPKAKPASQANWDASSSEDDEADLRKKYRANSGTLAPAKEELKKPTSADVKRKVSTDDWDDDSDEGMRRTRVLFPVPFPQKPADESQYVPCANRCYVTNLGAKLKHPHPPLLELRNIAEGKSIAADDATMMWRKGAFYVNNPEVGNGCSDHHNDVHTAGGCPFILCLKCNYVVVRLQGAAWKDDDGTIDLYLTTRNFYPDWSCLAESCPVGVKRGGERVLVTDDKAAAYCCQCSWLTVRGEKEVIETRMTEAVLMKNLEKGDFATVLPSETKEGKRPPLWVCKGHKVDMK